MQQALDQARRGVGRTAPNPPVGSVIVKDGVALGAGWHHGAGQPHAEREAMAAVRASHGAEALRGSTAYVTLEPCCTHGRTPPCTDGLIEAGVARVVYAIQDPNPAHAGRADAILKAAGIEVAHGVLEQEAARLIRPFAKVQRTGLPWVILKTAMSLDGRITRPPGEGMWLTGPEARAQVQRLRAESDAILTSGETVRRDRPRLDLRDPALLEGRSQPWRIVVTRDSASLPRDAPLFTDAAKDRTLIEERPDDLRTLLARLVRERGIHTLMVECGGRLAAQLVEAGLVDEWVAFLAPLLAGGPVPALAGQGTGGLKLADPVFTRHGPDVMLRARFEGGE